MNRPLFSNRFGLRGRTTSKQSIRHTRLGLEQLEERRLLTSCNLLVSTFDPTGASGVNSGSNVLEYSETTNLRLPGGVYTGDHNLANATGLAVAPDGSYYVSGISSSPTGPNQVLHYSKAGVFLNVLGANDANPAMMYYPGTLAFGPNGNLYVADLGTGAIYQFDTTSTAQQYLAADTVWLPSGFSPGGFTFATDATHDLIVGNLNGGEVLRFNADGSSTTLIPSTSGINPLAILALSNGNLLIADSDLGGDPTGHHQIVEYNAETGETSQFVDLTTPVGTAGNLPQPTALLLDTDGNLLVGLSPDHNGNGAVEKFNIQTGSSLGTIVSGIGTPSGLALEPVAPSDILFSTYFDSNDSSVLRYNDATQLPVPGGAATGAGAAATGTTGLGAAAGLAVAPDGSYYVSSDATGQVLHFSSSGVFLNVLGAGDGNPAPLYAPGALAFGPDGNLYVAEFPVDNPTNGIDVPGAIYQFDTTSSKQQYRSADTLTLGFTPGGFTFAADATRDLIVGDLDAQSVVEFSANGTPTTLIAPGSGINFLAILALSNGNLLIADADLGGDPTGHHQIVEYDAAKQTTSQFIDLTAPLGTGSFAGDPPQPSSLMFDTDGNLLVGLSPDDGDDGAVEKFNIQTGAWIGTIATGVGEPSGLALAPSQVSDLLVGDYDGGGALRYSSASQPIAGGVAPGAYNLATTGVAVASDGSYYVSCPGIGPQVDGFYTGQVLHYSNSGAFLNVLDQGDASGPTLYEPGTLAFGPNGNLYVADLDGAGVGAGMIYQYDTTASTSQHFVSAETLPPGFTPGGFTFAADATRDLIAGDLNSGEVAQFNADGTIKQEFVTPYTQDPDNPNQGTTIFPTAIAALGNGNLLIADSDEGTDPADHHQILEYSSTSTPSLSQFIDLTTPLGTGSFADDPPQPTSLQLTPDGNLLVGLSPDHSGDGAVEEFDLATQQLISKEISSIGTPAGLALLPPNVMTVSATVWTNAGSPITALTIAVNGSDLQVYQTGTPANVISSQPAASVGEIQISGPDNPANSLTIDFSGGSPIPADGVFFDGASGSSVNTVKIVDSAGSNAYGLNGTQLSLNGVPAVTMTNTQALGLDIGSGSLDLGGAAQAVGSITLVSGSLKDGTLSSGSFAVQSGKVSANLAGPGGLSKTGSGTATLSGSNSYEGGTTVTAGKLVVASAAALPDGTALMVGANAASIFGHPTAEQPSAVLSSNSAVVGILPAATDGALVSASRATTFLPAALPAAQPWKVACDSVWSSYTPATAPSVGPAYRAAGNLAWWDSLLPSSNSEGSTAGNDRRIAALDALLTQYFDFRA
jgi:autotransporter-associated beta strand protein